MLTRVTRVTRERQRGARGEFMAERPHLTNLPPIYSEEGRDLYLVTVFHFQVNLIFSCYLVILWGIAGLPSAMKRLRMISL